MDIQPFVTDDRYLLRKQYHTYQPQL